MTLENSTWVKQTIKKKNHQKKVVTYLGKKKKTWTIPFSEQLSFMKFGEKKTQCLKNLHFEFDINRSLNCYFWPILLKRLTIDQLLIFTFMEEFLGELENFFFPAFYIMFHCMWVWFPSSVIFTNGTLIEACISAFLISYFGQLCLGWADNFLFFSIYTILPDEIIWNKILTMSLTCSRKIFPSFLMQ